MRLRERAAEPATEAHGRVERGEWPLEPAPLPRPPAAAKAPRPTEERPPEPAAATAASPAATRERTQPVTNGDAPSVEVWAARVSSARRRRRAREAPRTLELPGLEAVKEKGAKALSSLLGRDGDASRSRCPQRPRARRRVTGRDPREAAAGARARARCASTRRRRSGRCGSPP